MSFAPLSVRAKFNAKMAQAEGERKVRADRFIGFTGDISVHFSVFRQGDGRNNDKASDHELLMRLTWRETRGIPHD